MEGFLGLLYFWIAGGSLYLVLIHTEFLAFSLTDTHTPSDLNAE